MHVQIQPVQYPQQLRAIHLATQLEWNRQACDSGEELQVEVQIKTLK